MAKKSEFRLNGFLAAGFCFAALSPAFVYFGKEGHDVVMVIGGCVFAALSGILIYHGKEVSSRRQNRDFKEEIEAASTKQNAEFKKEIEASSKKKMDELTKSLEKKVNEAIERSQSSHEHSALVELKEDLVKRFGHFDEGGGRAVLRTQIEQTQKKWNDFFKLAYSTLLDYLQVVQAKRPELHIEFDFPPLPENMARRRWVGKVKFGSARTWKCEFYDQNESAHVEISAEPTRSFRIYIYKDGKLYINNSGLIILPGFKGPWPEEKISEITPEILKKLIEAQLFECRG